MITFIAVDGTKVAGNASRDRTLTYEQLAKAIVDEQFWEVHANKAYEHYRATGRMKNGRRLGAPPKP